METIKLITRKDKITFEGGIEISHPVHGMLWRQYSEIIRLNVNDALDDAVKMRDDLLAEKTGA